MSKIRNILLNSAYDGARSPACAKFTKKHFKNSAHFPFLYCTIPNFRYHTSFLIHSTLGTLSMNKLKIALLTAMHVGLFYCVNIVKICL